MPLYFLLHDAARFHEALRPALAEAWRRRSFEPCRALCSALAPAAVGFAERYHTGHDESLLARVTRGAVPFDRAFTASRRGPYTSLTATIWYGCPVLSAESSRPFIRPPAPITPTRSVSLEPNARVAASAVSPPPIRKLRRLGM